MLKMRLEVLNMFFLLADIGVKTSRLRGENLVTFF